MNSKSSYNNPKDKDFSAETQNANGILQFGAAVGDINNDNITTCKLCKAEGFKHEAIIIEKVPGRVLSDGSNEVKQYNIKDYATELPHKHKYKRFYKGWDLGRFFE